MANGSTSRSRDGGGGSAARSRRGRRCTRRFEEVAARSPVGAVVAPTPAWPTAGATGGAAAGPEGAAGRGEGTGANPPEVALVVPGTAAPLERPRRGASGAGWTGAGALGPPGAEP